MPDDLAGAHAAGVHRDDLVVETREPALVLGDQLRIEAGLAVARHLQLDRPGVGDDALPAVAVTPVAGLLATQMMVHLGVQHPFGQRLLQIIEQAIRIKYPLCVGASQELVKDGVRNTRLFASRHGRAPLLPSCPTPHAIPDSSPAFTADDTTRFAKPAADAKNLHRPSPAGDVLGDAFAWKEERTLSRG